MRDLYKEYHLLMFSVAKQFCPRKEDCEDLVQTCLERLIQNISTLRALKRCTLASYLVSTIRNTFYTQYTRERKVLPQCISFEEATEPYDPIDDQFTMALIERLDREELLSQLWARLSEEERLLLEGKYFLTRSDKELAQVLGCRASSIRMKLSRARRNALHILNSLEEDAADAKT